MHPKVFEANQVARPLVLCAQAIHILDAYQPTADTFVEETPGYQFKLYVPRSKTYPDCLELPGTSDGEP